MAPFSKTSQGIPSTDWTGQDLEQSEEKRAMAMEVRCPLEDRLSRSNQESAVQVAHSNVCKGIPVWQLDLALYDK